MGSYYTYGATRKDVIAELTQGFTTEAGTGTQAIKHCARGNILYVVHESTTATETYRFIGVYILLKDREGWGYKPMEESMGPYFYSCPLGYLEIVPHNTNPKWREGVKEYHARRRKVLTSVVETATL